MPTDYWDDIAWAATRDWTTLVPLIVALVVFAVIALLLLAALAVAIRFVFQGKSFRAGGVSLTDGTDSAAPQSVAARVDDLERAMVSTKDLGRLTLERLDALSIVSRTILEVVRDNYCNGNVVSALGVLDRSDRETKEFLFDAASSTKEGT